jgi:hypothetical protein
VYLEAQTASAEAPRLVIMRTGVPRGAPADVYYVVETSGRILGEREHSAASSLYETMSQAQAELARLVALNDGKAYSVWKGSTYIEPARWAQDVVLEDGTVVHASKR